MLHWGEEQSPNWRKGQGGPRGQKYDTCHHLSPIYNIFLSLPSSPPTKFPLLGRSSPSHTASTAGGHIPHTPRAMPGQDWCHHQCTTGQTVPQPYPEPMTQRLRALCINDQNHTEPPSNAGAECILNIPTFWAGKGKGREANQAQRKEHHSQRPLLTLPRQGGAGLAKLLTSSPSFPHCISQHQWDGARQMFSGPSMHKSTPSLPVSHFWALAALNPCFP